MGFLRYFFTKSDASPYGADDEELDPIESNRERIAAERKRQLKQSSNLDLGKRVAQLETQLADAGLVIETLIELLEERMGLTRKEIEARLEQLTSHSTKPVESKSVKKEPTQAILPRLISTDDKIHFEPRRKWRDARGQF